MVMEPSGVISLLSMAEDEWAVLPLGSKRRFGFSDPDLQRGSLGATTLFQIIHEIASLRKELHELKRRDLDQKNDISALRTELMALRESFFQDDGSRQTLSEVDATLRELCLAAKSEELNEFSESKSFSLKQISDIIASSIGNTATIAKEIAEENKYSQSIIEINNNSIAAHQRVISHKIERLLNG